MMMGMNDVIEFFMMVSQILDDNDVETDKEFPERYTQAMNRLRYECDKSCGVPALDVENRTPARELNEAKKDLCNWIMNLTVREFFELSTFLEAGYDIPEGILYTCSECQKEYQPFCEACNEKNQCFRHWCRHYNIEMSDEK